jgi:glycosyltransferase involved in cell wall biosynthesis
MNRKIVYIDNFLAEHGATPTTGTTLTQLFINKGYTVIRGGAKKNKAARLAEMLGTIIKHKDAIVLIATYSTGAFFFAWACAQLCRLLRVTYIPCLHGGNLPERIKKNPALSAQVFAHSYTNVVVSGYLQQCVMQRRWPSTLIPNSIHLKNYPFLQRLSARPKLLWVRSFHTIYNPQLAVKIVQALSTVYKDVSLTMVGPDKDGSLGQCKKLAEESGVSGKIVFTGRLSVAEWVKLSASHDIFINTTDFDNLPVSVIEAMATGLPVVSTNVGGLEYLITDGVNGFLVPPGSLTAFKTRIEDLVNNPELASGISKQAGSEAAKYSEDKVMQLWNELFKQIP